MGLGELNYDLELEGEIREEKGEDIGDIASLEWWRNIRSDRYVSLLHQNVQYGANKWEQIEVFLVEQRPEVFVMTEHGMKREMIGAYNMDHYVLADSFCREVAKGGGVGIYVSDSQRFRSEKSVGKFCRERVFEVAAIRWEIGDLKVLVVAGYRPPKGDIEEFLLLFTGLLEELLVGDTKVIVVGDININMLKKDSVNERYADILSSFNLKLRIKCPTRVTDRSGSLIDHVISNLDRQMIGVQVLEGFISDHYGQKVYVNLEKEDNEVELKRERDFSKDNLEYLKFLLKKEDWKEVIEGRSTNEKYTLFAGLLDYYLDVACPVKQKICRRGNNRKRWISREVWMARRDLKLCYEDLKRGGDSKINEIYKLKKKRYKEIVKEAKKVHLNDRLLDSNNVVKDAWGVINEGKKGKGRKWESIKIIKEAEVIEQPEEVCDALNNYFVEVVEDMLGKIEGGLDGRDVADYGSYNSQTMYLRETTIEEVEEIIKGLKNKGSCGLDGVSAILLKTCAQYLLKPLENIINKSMEEGIYPDKLKDSKVRPIFKKGERTQEKSYRPITLVSSISKIFEIVILRRILDFVLKYNILSKEHHGFRQGKSTKTATTEFMYWVMQALDRGEKVCGVFMDQSKAFDCVVHRILMEKLYRYGLRGVVYDWLESYLCGRQQCVELQYKEGKVIQSFRSSMREVRYGVPQGSVLGPFLFLLYTNDLPSCVKGKVTMYADDTSLICSGRTIEDLEDNICESVEAVCRYLRGVRLCVNEEKTKYMRFRSRRDNSEEKITVLMNGCVLEEVNNLTFLGIDLDKNFVWRKQVDKVCGRISVGLFLMRKLVEMGNLGLLKTVYYGLIYPHLSYGIHMWGSSMKRLMNRVFILQKRAVRYMGGLRGRNSCRGMFAKFKIMTVYAVYILESIMCLWEADLGMERKRHEYDTRDKADPGVVFRNTELTKRDPVVAGRRFFGKLPRSLRGVGCKRSFRKAVRNYLIEKELYSVGNLWWDDWIVI